MEFKFVLLLFLGNVVDNSDLYLLSLEAKCWPRIARLQQERLKINKEEHKGGDCYRQFYYLCKVFPRRRSDRRARHSRPVRRRRSLTCSISPVSSSVSFRACWASGGNSRHRRSQRLARSFCRRSFAGGNGPPDRRRANLAAPTAVSPRVRVYAPLRTKENAELAKLKKNDRKKQQRRKENTTKTKQYVVQQF